MSPIEIARIQLDAAKAERQKIAANLRLLTAKGKEQGATDAAVKILNQLAASIERGDFS